MILTLMLTVAAVLLIAFAIGTSRAAAPRAGAHAPAPDSDGVFEELVILDVALDGELDGDLRPDDET